MTTIHKYPLAAAGDQTLVLPDGAVILNAIEQHGRAALNVMADPEAELTDRYTIRMVGTGQPADGLGGFVFLGTCCLYSGALMTHIFARLEVAE